MASDDTALAEFWAAWEKKTGETAPEWCDWDEGPAHMEMTLTALRRIAAESKIHGRSKMSKLELVGSIWAGRPWRAQRDTDWVGRGL